MNIAVRDSGQFKQLLEALIDDLIDARTHFRLHQDLNAAIPDYTVEFNQSAVFWNLTRTAHLEATLLRLCRAYESSNDKPNLNLKNFLETIRENLHFFDEPNFRERLVGNPFVDSLAEKPRKPESNVLATDLVSVSPDDPAVANLHFWRHRYIAHRSRSSVLSPETFGQQNPLLFTDIQKLIDNGVRIVNHYSELFSATLHTSPPVKDYQRLLDAVREGLRARKAQFQQQIAAVRSRPQE